MMMMVMTMRRLLMVISSLVLVIALSSRTSEAIQLPPICEGACGSTNTITAVSPPGGTKEFARKLMDTVASGSKTTMTAEKGGNLDDAAVESLKKELRHLIAKKQAISVARRDNGGRIRRFLKNSERAHKKQVALAKKQPHSRRSQLVSVRTVSERQFKRSSGHISGLHGSKAGERARKTTERAKKKFARIKNKMDRKIRRLKNKFRPRKLHGKDGLLKRAYDKTKRAAKKTKAKAKRLFNAIRRH